MRRRPITLVLLLAGAGCRGQDATRPVPVGTGPDPASVFRAAGDDLRWSIEAAMVAPAVGSSERAVLASFRALLDLDPTVAAGRFAEVFELVESVGRDDHGDVLVTGYFAPEHAARRERSDRFRFPLYRRPVWLPAGVVGPPRAAITRRLEGEEIAWLDNALDAYLVEVNGAARLRFEDGSTLCLTHDGTNERPYTSLGRLLVLAGLVPAAEIDLPAIRNAHRDDPALLETMMLGNERFVFFKSVPPERWPPSISKMPLRPLAAVATDKQLFPAGGLAILAIDPGSPGSDGLPPLIVAVDHDTGGAIVGPGRVDVFCGIGDDAGRIAGRVRATGRLWFVRAR